MPVIKIQHSFQGISGVAEDQYVNTFHVLASSTDSDSLDGMAAAVRTFYNTMPSLGTHPLTWYLAGMADTVGERVKIYDLSDPIPRTPLFDESYTPSGSFGNAMASLPSEVAACLSYAAAPTSGVPMSRLRGRIYIGPLSMSAADNLGPSDAARPSAIFREDMVRSAKRLANDLATIDPVAIWVVYSPTSNTSHGIVRWWADDAWDTQRRRGDAPTTRFTMTI